MIEYKFTKQKNLEDYKSCRALIRVFDIVIDEIFFEIFLF